MAEKKVNTTKTDAENEEKKENTGEVEKEESVDLEDILAKVQAKADEIIKNAEEKAAKIIENAGGGKSAPVVDPYLEEYVEVKLFKDNKDYKDDVFVSLNGESVQIKRGVPVKIKRKFKNVLDLSEKQDIKTARFIEKESNKYRSESEKRGF